MSDSKQDPEKSLYDTLAAETPDDSPGPDTGFTATKETIDNDREDVSEDVLELSD